MESFILHRSQSNLLSIYQIEVLRSKNVVVNIYKY